MFLKQKIHFIGIGGIGMSAIAKILFQKGFKISGSDQNENLIIKDLKKKGVKVFLNHSISNVNDVDIVVYSSAIDKTNVELKAAKKRKIPTFSRAMMLAEVMRLKSSITVAGSHGKTTTTSLIACIFENAGLDPTVINGGIINSIGANAKLGNGKFIIAEADESDGSFTLLPSTIGVINNIDLEHLDFYKSIDEIKKVFIKYAEKIPFYGFLCVCNDDKNSKSIIKYIKSKPIITFGTSESSNFIAKNIKTLKNSISSFDICINFKSKKIIKNIQIPLIGKHNVLNALCAFSVCYQLNIPIKKISEGLKKFSGVKRRFSILNKSSKSLIIDDYAHHPSEIKTTLESLKKITKNKVIAIFEPHRYTRINNLLKEFIESFSKADFVFILPIYSAGEKNIKKIKNLHLEKIFKKKFKNNKIIKAVENEQNLFKDLKDLYKGKNNIIFLGAGLSTNIAQKFSIYIE